MSGKYYSEVTDGAIKRRDQRYTVYGRKIQTTNSKVTTVLCILNSNISLEIMWGLLIVPVYKVKLI